MKTYAPVVAALFAIVLVLATAAHAAPVLMRDDKITAKEVGNDAGFLEICRNNCFVKPDENPFLDGKGEPLKLDVSELPSPALGVLKGGVYGVYRNEVTITRNGVHPEVFRYTKMHGIRFSYGTGGWFFHAEYGLVNPKDPETKKVPFVFFGTEGGNGAPAKVASLADQLTDMLTLHGKDWTVFQKAVGTTEAVQYLLNQQGMTVDEAGNVVPIPPPPPAPDGGKEGAGKVRFLIPLWITIALLLLGSGSAVTANYTSGNTKKRLALFALVCFVAIGVTVLANAVWR